MAGLEINNLTVTRNGKEVLKDISFEIKEGEVVLLTGGNGAGKSTLALSLLGHPDCVTVGSIRLQGEDLISLSTSERARRGLFLAHQEPPAIAGVSVADVLRGAMESRMGEGFSYPAFSTDLRQALLALNLDYAFSKKEMHAQFSGGEKKKIELLSLLLLQPKVAILDEIDSGMDEEARKLLLTVMERLQAGGCSFLIISHQPQAFKNIANIRELFLKEGRLR
jgi:Fe-S cluster assembly ATP-binding protein